MNCSKLLLLGGDRFTPSDRRLAMALIAANLVYGLQLAGTTVHGRDCFMRRFAIIRAG